MSYCPLPTPSCMFVTIPVTRSAAGSYTSGRWAAGSTTALSITASVQPVKLKHEELLHLPAGDRNRSAIRVYTPAELRSVNEADGTPADLVTWDGEHWEVVKVDIWSLGVSHYKAIALRVSRP